MPRRQRLQELEPLRPRQELDRNNPRGIGEDALGLPGRAHPHRHDVFLVAFGWHRLDAGGCGQHTAIGDERRGRDLGRHEPRLEAWTLRQERWQAGGQIGIYDALEAPLGEPRERGEGDGEHIEPQRDGLPMKVAA